MLCRSAPQGGSRSPTQWYLGASTTVGHASCVCASAAAVLLSQVLDLTPLSSLTRLDMPSLTPWDKLPPSLQELRLTTPFDFGPLLQCTSLQTLTVQEKQGVTPWEELQDVCAALPGLQSVAVELGNAWGVGYYGGEELPWATWGLHHTGNKLAGGCEGRPRWWVGTCWWHCWQECPQ